MKLSNSPQGSGLPMKRVFMKKATLFNICKTNPILKRRVATSMKKNYMKDSILPSNPLQKKIDYYFTPYNRKLAFKKNMSFDGETDREWIDLTNFILTGDKATFR
jgi:hypothetical protein